MKTGLNVGYARTKAISDNHRSAIFDSVSGTPDKATFSINSANGRLALVEPRHVLVGAEAVKQSRFTHRPEGRDWVGGDTWMALAQVAMTELTPASVDMQIVSGLPIGFYQPDDIERMKDALLGEHNLKREGRDRQTITVTDVRVIPEPFGTVLDAALNGSGGVSDRKIATGRIGVIDLGGKTTNLLSVDKLSDVGRETASINQGAWDIVRAFRSWLENHYPGTDMRDHELSRVIANGCFSYYGQSKDVSGAIEEIIDPLAREVFDTASQLWNLPRLERILITGGGAHLMGEVLTIMFHEGQAQVVNQPGTANARGFCKYAIYIF